MTEKIKIALLHWARKVIDQNVEWDDEKTHDAIQNLYELSIVQKMLLEQKHTDQNLWRYQQAQLNEMIESLTGKPKTESSKEENMEVALQQFTESLILIGSEEANKNVKIKLIIFNFIITIYLVFFYNKYFKYYFTTY